MKTRYGFVSNSSSSSFCLSLGWLNAQQLASIINHSELGSLMDMECPEDSWIIEVNLSEVTGRTCMDNFDMSEFMEKIGVDPAKAKWRDGFS